MFEFNIGQCRGMHSLVRLSSREEVFDQYTSSTEKEECKTPSGQEYRHTEMVGATRFFFGAAERHSNLADLVAQQQRVEECGNCFSFVNRDFGTTCTTLQTTDA